MKVYFAGSITGGRDDQEIYFKIINFLKEKGYAVLTEHIGDKNLSSSGETNFSSEEIFKKDLEWIKIADILIAEVTQVSLGVGYEIGFAESIGKKIICLYREGSEKKLSCMISGNKNVKVIRYKEVNDVLEKLNKTIEELR
jgi:2'-deoxynucleoside 5'-phosphate N-hydrolase